MNSLFDNLLVSSPNGGGLFFISAGQVFKLDGVNTTGLSVKGRKILRGVQPSGVYLYDVGLSDIGQGNPVGDIHDVYLADNCCYLVGTARNEIIKIGCAGEELQRWVFPGEEDALHINCIEIWNGRVIFSAFGEFRAHRGYKGKTRGAGFIQDLLTGRRLITGLSQPHSLVAIDQNLLLANSENQELSEFGPSGNLIRTLKLDGYARGICVVEGTIYVGLSCSRNIKTQGVDTAAIVAIDRDSWKALGRIVLPAKEIYSIQRLTDGDELIYVLANIASTSSARLVDALTECESEVANLNHAVAYREVQIASLNEIVVDREGQIAGLNQVVADREGQIASLVGTIEEIYRSNIWRLLKPVRWYGRQRQRLGSNWRARYRQLLERSRFVLRQEGVAAFSRRMAGYIGRSLRRRWAMQRIERYLPAQKARDIVPPLVTFIIPIYDRTNVLREAICSALGQSLQVFEVILVTDGSPPATLSVVEEFRAHPRVRIFNYPTSSGNAVRGRNKGILEARGRYIAFLDSDDIAAPERLEVCLPLLESGQADVVYGAWRAKLDGTRQVDGLADGQVVYSPDCDLEMLRKVCVPCQSTVMVRRELLLKAGFLKQSMKYREDHELWARLAYHGARFKALPHVLTDLRLHAGNNELNFKANDAHWERLLGEEYLRPGLRPKKIAFLLGCLGISGGAAVVLRHVSLLLDQGHDVFVINVSGQGDLAWFGNPAIRVFGLDQLDRCGIDNIDLLFATFWTTVELLERIPALRKLYFVQSDERLFYDEPSVQAQVAATYRGAYEYVAIARWICDMLRDEFGQQQVHYVPNGLDLQMFYPGSPLQEKKPLRPRVLIEGPISVPFKGVADACAALRDLDCEVWIVSSSGRPEEHWRYDRSFEAVNHTQMRQIYASCDILLKMSRVESFAYPPLEAMACGCAVVLGEVRGGIEYAEDGVNVLKVAAGDINQARAAVQRLLDDKSLRERLQAAGFLTAKSWSWEASREAMEQVLENTQDDVQVTLISS